MVADPKFLTPPHDSEPLAGPYPPSARTHRFLAEVAKRLNGENGLEARVAALEPQHVSKTSADSPYQMVDGDYVLADMSTGAMSLTVPTSGNVFGFTRKGTDGIVLTIVGTVNGVVNPTFIFDGTSRVARKIGSKWRWF